jgi:hypothetical protein
MEMAVHFAGQALGIPTLGFLGGNDQDGFASLNLQDSCSEETACLDTGKAFAAFALAMVDGD